MKLSQLAFIVTDDCNFRCSYCPQIKEKKYIKPETIEKAIDFFYPFLDEDSYIVYCGGEPLLAFDAIKYAVSLIQKKNKSTGKKTYFALTTNGSVITDAMLDFFDTYHFDITLSFDGVAQEIGRESGTQTSTETIMKRIQSGGYPNITFSINSVFSPTTVFKLFESLQSIIQAGCTELKFDIADNTPWQDSDFIVLEEQLNMLSDYLISYYRENAIIPVEPFRATKVENEFDEDTSFACVAGRKRMAVTPSEDLWGCYVFHNYLKNRQALKDYQAYSFGKLSDFIQDYQSIYARGMYYYDALDQDYFYTEHQQCLFCRELNSCSVCPANAALTTSSIGKISPWVCQINRIQGQVRKKFLFSLNTLNPSNDSGKNIH